MGRVRFLYHPRWMGVGCVSDGCRMDTGWGTTPDTDPSNTDTDPSDTDPITI